MILNEVDKPIVKKTVVVYSGRFQPFHKGHYVSYLKLCNKFGRDNVYIGTSDDTSGSKSPFNFNEKVKIMTTMFGIPSNKIVQVKNPYAPKEILSKFDGKTTQYIAAVGEKDADRLKGKYFKPYKDKAGYGYEEIGYVYPVPSEKNPISGTDVRSWLGKNNKDKEKNFLKAYPKFDKEIYKMITGKLNEDGLPGGIGVGLELPGGYINGAPTGSTNETLDAATDSAKYRYEPHPTRHEREHPSDEPDWHKKNEPYDPITELVDKYITNEMFEEFARQYFKEESDAQKMGLKHLGGGYYGKDDKGPATHKSDNGKIRTLTPAEMDAVKKKSIAKGASNAPTNEPKPSQPGQPVNKDATAQGKADKKKEEPQDKKGEKAGAEKAPPPPQQKLSGDELKSNAEKKQDEKKGWLSKWGDSFKSEVKEIGDTIKNFLDEDEAHEAHEGHDPHSPTRKKWTETATDFISKMPANIAKHALKVAKQKVHQLKNTGRGIQSLVVSVAQGGKPRLGMFKDKDGKWKHSKHEAERQSKAIKNTLKDVAITAAAVVTGGAAAGAYHAAAHGGLAAIAHGASHGVTHTLSHGVAGFAQHMAVDFAQHCGKESLALAAGMSHGAAAGTAAVHNVISAALHEGMQSDNNEDNVKQSASMYTELLKQTLERMQDFEPNPKQYLEMLKSYAATKQKDSLNKLTGGALNENISDSKKENIQHFVEYATKRLKLKETPNVTLVGGKEYGNVKSSLGGYSPEDKSIYVSTEGRLTADILRTVAHEMVHRKQDEMGYIKDSVQDGADGSPIENQAHSIAGILMREYGRINKQIYNEDINIDVDKGDTVLMGKFKNKKVIAKDFGTDDHGMPTINGKVATTFRIDKEEKKSNPQSVFNEVGSNDWHFKAIMKLWDKGSSFTRKKIGAVILKNPNATRNDIARELRSYGYMDATDATDQLGLDEKKNLKEVSVNTAQDGQQDGAYIPKGKGRVLDGNDGVNKSDDWYYSGGYIQMDFPVADQIWGDDDENQTVVKYSARNLPRFEEEPTKFLKEDSLKELTQGLFAGKIKIGGQPVDLEVELLGADNKTKEFITKIIYIDKKYQSKLPIGSTFKIPARIFRMPGGGWHKIKSSAFKESLNEGGAYGHMSHPFDDMDLTFGDLKKIIKGALTGNLELTREKTDGQALAISWKNGRLIAARNKSHLQNAGARAMGIEDVASKFGGRGGLTDAYNFAMKDLSAAISGLSDAQRKKIFNEGKCFMNLEVIWPTSVNVIPYGQALLVFHNTTCYDEKGSAIGADQSAATKLAGMIKQVNADVQSKYTIQGPPVTELPKNEELSSKQTKYLTQLQKLQFEFQLSDKDGVSEYHQAWWENFINKDKPKLQKLEKEALIRRWAFGDKSFRLNTIADKDAQKWAIEHDKVNVQKQQKENVRQFEEIFLGVGADVLSFMGSVLTANPNAAVANMKQRLKATAEKVRGSGDPSKIAKLKMELSRLASIGGKDKIVPNEGIVFVYKGNTYKLTGTFAPLNQILGIFYE